MKDSKAIKPPSNNANNNSSSTAGLNSSVTITKPRILSNISLTLDADMADKSIASLVGLFLIIVRSLSSDKSISRCPSYCRFVKAL